MVLPPHLEQASTRAPQLSHPMTDRKVSSVQDQIADALTKPLAQNDFQRHRCFMCGK